MITITTFINIVPRPEHCLLIHSICCRFYKSKGHKQMFIVMASQINAHFSSQIFKTLYPIGYNLRRLSFEMQHLLYNTFVYNAHNVK